MSSDIIAAVLSMGGWFLTSWAFLSWASRHQ